MEERRRLIIHLSLLSKSLSVLTSLSPSLGGARGRRAFLRSHLGAAQRADLPRRRRDGLELLREHVRRPRRGDRLGRERRREVGLAAPPPSTERAAGPPPRRPRADSGRRRQWGEVPAVVVEWSGSACADTR